MTRLKATRGRARGGKKRLAAILVVALLALGAASATLASQWDEGQPPPGVTFPFGAEPYQGPPQPPPGVTFPFAAEPYEGPPQPPNPNPDLSSPPIPEPPFEEVEPVTEELSSEPMPEPPFEEVEPATEELK